jgi:hypothetical protein
VVTRRGWHAAQTTQCLDEAAFCSSRQFDHTHGITIGVPVQNSTGAEFKLPAQFLWHDRLAFGCNGARHGKNFQLLMPLFKHKNVAARFVESKRRVNDLAGMREVAAQTYFFQVGHGQARVVAK